MGVCYECGNDIYRDESYGINAHGRYHLRTGTHARPAFMGPPPRTWYADQRLKDRWDDTVWMRVSKRKN